MAASMFHRGPDDLAAAAFPDAGAAIGAARLALVDMAHGRQPIANEDGSVWALLSGEIYNHRALRDELLRQGHRMRTQCDTEVLAHLYEQHGEAMCGKLDGMFAAAVFDLRRRQFLLVRDHAGMKPLYYAERNGGFAFASEIRAFFAGGLLAPQANWEDLEYYFDFGYVPAPGCAFVGLRKLPAGCWLRWRNGRTETQRYWQPPLDQAARDLEAPARLEELLRSATHTHLQGEAEAGCFLSGGWDSSIVAALACEKLGRLKTFSLVFPESPGLNEASHARAVAKDLGTEHEEVEYRPAMLPAMLEQAAWKLEEPSSSTPAVLVGLLSQLASRKVKTVVGGEGSDELFAGYEWLRPRLPYQLNTLIPRPLARMLLPLRWAPRWRRAARQLAAASADDIDFEFVRRSHPRDFPLPVAARRREFTGADAYAVVARQIGEEPVARTRERLPRRLLLEYGGRLTGGVLYSCDRMAMAESLEVRLPFLDRHIVEYAMRLPAEWKLHRGQEKAILKPLAAKYAPAVAHRRKLGLQIPEMDYHDPATREFAFQLLLAENSLFPRREMERALRRWFGPARREIRFLPLLIHLQCWWNTFLVSGSYGATLGSSDALPVNRVAWADAEVAP